MMRRRSLCYSVAASARSWSVSSLSGRLTLDKVSTINAMTVDVEDYFQVSAFASTISRETWTQWPLRLASNLDRILQAFADNDVRATFFTLGWFGEHHPELVRRITDAGHELASHGYQHERVDGQSPQDFRLDVRRTKQLLEDVTGQPVIGYRAASFSMGETTPWSHQILEDEGYRYSSSIYPIAHDHYGSPDGPTTVYVAGRKGFLEVPLSTVTAFGRNWPCAGGGYFRLLPYGYSRWAIRSVNERKGVPAVFYFHPWELDPEQPRVPGVPLKARLRHYVNLSRFDRRLQSLLRDFKWGRMDSIYLKHADSQDSQR